eukprot:5672024-Amphidinium_carterae.2
MEGMGSAALPSEAKTQCAFLDAILSDPTKPHDKDTKAHSWPQLLVGTFGHSVGAGSPEASGSMHVLQHRPVIVLYS